MSDVTYSRPWMLFVFVAHLAAMATSVGTVIAVAFSASAWILLAIPVAWGIVVAAILRLIVFFNAKTDFDRGLEPRFLVAMSTTAQLRVYDDFLILRETRQSVRTVWIPYRDVLEVEAGRFVRSLLPFSLSLRLSFVDEEVGDRTVTLPAPDAERIAAYIVGKMAHEKKPVADPSEGPNPARRSASSSETAFEAP